MKKFLALLTALSLLAFAGSAFATTITASPTSVTVTAGQTATATITGTASHGGELSYAVTGDGAAFTTLSGTTLTFAPASTVQANTYDVTVTVTETYGDPSAAGHSGPQTETASVTIAVTVNSPVAPLTFTVTPSATTIMAGETVNFRFSSTGGNGGTVYSLVDAVEGVVMGNAAAIFTPKSAGTYTLAFFATDSLGIGAVQGQTVTITVAEVLAAKATLSKNPISVDESVTVTLTATGGIGAATFTTSTSGVTLGATSNNTATATFRSSEAGIYALRFTAADTASHTAAANVSVIVDAPAPEAEAEDVVEKVVTEEKQETVSVAAHELSSDLTTDVNPDTIANTMSQTSSAAIASDDSYTEEEKALAEGIDEKNDATVNDLKGSAFPAEAENVPQDEVTVTPSNTNLAETVAKDNANAGRGSSAPIMGFGVSSPRDGIIKLPAPRQPATLWGLIIRVLKAVTNNNNRALPGGFAAAADDTDTTVFLDSNGRVTTTIPTSVDVNGNPRIGGYMTIATYVKANEPVDMILSVPTEELETAGVTTATKEVAVTLPSFIAAGTSYFTTFVSSDILTTNDYYRIGENVLTSKVNNTTVNEDWARTAEERQMATDNNYTMITRLAEIDATDEAATHTYIVAVNFSADQAKLDRIDTTSEDGGFIFYPNGPAEAAANAEVLKLVVREDGTTGFDDLTPEDIKNGVKAGYLAFSVAGGSALTKPMLAVKLVPASTVFSFALSTNSVTVQQGRTETLNITPVNNSGDVSYVAAEGSTTLDWITFENNVATFAPTTSTAARTYNVTITGVDGALKAYSTDITVVVTSSATPTPSGDVTPALTITASKSSVSMVLGTIETLTLSSANVLGTATYSVVAYEDGVVVGDEAGVTLDSSTGEAVIAPSEIGTYSLVFTVTDSGRTSGSNTKSVTVPLTVRGGSVGSSGGGCDAGFGVLALAVLGGFIAARKK